jgi:hypothetical protein
MVLELSRETAGRAGGAIPAEFNTPVGTSWQRTRKLANLFLSDCFGVFTT